MGLVGKRGNLVRVVPTVAAVAYTAGDQFGGVNEIGSAVGSQEQMAWSKLVGLTVSSKGDFAPTLDLMFFDEDPDTEITSVDNGAFTITDAGLTKLISTVSVVATDYLDLGTNHVRHLPDLAVPLRSKDGSTSVWVAAMITTTDTPTAGDVEYKFHIEYQ